MSRPITIKYLDEIQLGFNQHDVDAIFSSFARPCLVDGKRPQCTGGAALYRERGDWSALRARYAQIPDM